MLGLRAPAVERIPVALAVLRLTASELTDAIAGGLLEDTLVGEMGGSGYAFYLDEHRVTKGFPSSGRAAMLSARLGEVDRQWLADLRGDALVLGHGRWSDDTDVPGVVVAAACRAGLLSVAEVVK